MSPYTSRSGSAWLREIMDANRSGQPVGLYSVCSAHPSVLRAAMRQALDDDSGLLIESTSNQVNQFGGYTGVSPAQFVTFLRSISQSRTNWCEGIDRCHDSPPHKRARHSQ